MMSDALPGALAVFQVVKRLLKEDHPVVVPDEMQITPFPITKVGQFKRQPV